VSSFNTSTCWGMTYMFNGCERLSSLDLSSFTTNKVDSMESMFQDCFNLSTIYVGTGWTTSSKTKNMFTNCGTSSVTIK